MPKSPKARFKFSLIFLSIGLLLIAISLGWRFYEARVLSFNTETPVIVATNKIQSSPVQIQIPSVGIDLPITESIIKNGVWQINPDGASHLKISDYPGNPGNIIIYAHNKRVLFGGLVGVKAGDNIVIKTKDGVEHNYQVTQTLVVDPNRIEVLSPTPDETLTLYTCTGFLDSQRFVVKAKKAV